MSNALLPWGEDWYSLPSDWFGQPARHPARYRIQCEAGVLRFSFWVDKAPQADASLRPGAFVEGLWENDVAELFVMADDGRYLEFNLSPYGAWWCAEFSAYRQRVRTLQLPSAEVSAEQGDDWWSCSLSLRADEIPPIAEAGWSQIRLNVTAILDPEQPEYLCSGHQDGGEPDFHLASSFLSPTHLPLPAGLPEETREAYTRFLAKRTLTRELLLAKVRGYVETIGQAHDLEQQLDLATSTDLARGLLRLIRECTDSQLPHTQAAVCYFLESDDADPDLGSAHGFADDASVFNCVCRHLGLPDLQLDLF